MSATVTYKGNTLTTVNNETKVLNTSGTWLEDNITITDTGGSSILVVDTPDSHGGTIREITAQNEVVLQAQKTITPASSQQTVLPDTGYDGFASVIVEAVTGDGNKCDTGTFTMQSDDRAVNSIAISHNLGEVPKVILVWTEDFDSTHDVPTSNTNGGFIFAPNLFNDLQERLSSSVNAPMNVYTSFALRNDVTPNLVAINTPTSTSYFPSNRLPTATEFYLPYVSSTYYWRAGITYKYLLVGNLS